MQIFRGSAFRQPRTPVADALGMARSRRVVIPNLPHQICLRGNNRRRLFSHPPDYQSFLYYVRVALEDSECLLHQLTLMTNHVHMIVTPPEEGALSRFVHRFGQRYAQVRNEQRNSSGKLFEERYFSKPIDTIEYLAAATIYNDANAARDGLVSDPVEHRWSTAPLHCGVDGVSAISKHMWTPTDWYLALGCDPEARASTYQEMITAYLATRDRDAEIPERVKQIEAASRENYRLRVERPNRSSARESQAQTRSRWNLKGRG